MMGPYLDSLRSRLGSQRILLPGVRAIILKDRAEVLLQRRTDIAYWGLLPGKGPMDAPAAIRRAIPSPTMNEVTS